MLAHQIFDKNKVPLRLFTSSGNVRTIADKYFKKFPAEVGETRYIATRRRLNGQIIIGVILEMDQPRE